MPTGEIGRFQPGGAALAVAAGRPVLVVSHNAGRYWPARRFAKRSGTVRLCISEPIETQGKTTKEVNDEAFLRMQQLTAEAQEPE